jgi:hypothetical protein
MLLGLTSLDQLIFKMKILFTFVTKQATLNEVNRTGPSPEASVSWGWGPTTFSITALSTTTPCIIDSFVALSKTSSIARLYIECHYAECHDLFRVMLNVTIMSVIMLNVVAPSLVIK